MGFISPVPGGNAACNSLAPVSAAASDSGLTFNDVVAAVEEGVSKRLKAKEEEIARVGKLNWALEERIKSLYAENQIWRNLAQNNEATANVLRTNLEQVLAAQVMVKEAPATADDAESCCCGDNAEDEEGIKVGLGREWRRACRSCREREPSVLLLPCRHLCLCMTCGPAVATCPICNCIKNGSVHAMGLRSVAEPNGDATCSSRREHLPGLLAFPEGKMLKNCAPFYKP
ncbi:hypothetical protein BHE74_00002920 [Ensete ventricosum]|uniref:Uncharacterized protein n=1 Tax=Ensete ventricosum TaxID=4639 RepID=A0A426X6A1_ENSVE|nr:hypothetical protein B296_00043525 [Ensete ventricosum]RWW19658.1 hypothetical protein GW17_00016272 [Ensete ventricosum]RWW88212.1 hypothetical protein BHE74_00002920 [Ensete ventricosum]RZR88143.1 hypothetical protein BHM03_00015663 [Ensete ventricosum]